MLDDAFKLTLDIIFPISKNCNQPTEAIEEDLCIEIGSEPGIGSKGPILA